jgi:hypothetical protein
MRKNDENVKKLIQLLQVASRERDEARDQLQKALNNNKFIVSPSNNFTGFTDLPPQNLTNTQLGKPAKANSRSITESNSSSPVDSLFDSVSSPELSTVNTYVNQNQPFIQDYNNNNNNNNVVRVPEPDFIESLAKGKNMPQKGKFLQSVLEAGPLLQTLLVAGPLPRWRNPPPLQPLYIPPVAIKGFENENIENEKKDVQSCVGMSCGSTQMVAMNVLNFGDGRSGSYLDAKRQRI